MELKLQGRYNFKHQPERLVYLGKRGNWHQFYKVGDATRAVWCELLETDLHLIEETKTGEENGRT
jgi:hypothetical protein